MIMIMIMKMVHWFQKQKEIFNELVNERSDKITKLEKKVDRDNLVDRYKENSPDEEFSTYDNALDLIDKIKKW